MSFIVAIGLSFIATFLTVYGGIGLLILVSHLLEKKSTATE